MDIHLSPAGPVTVEGVPLERLPRRDVPGGFRATAPGGGRLLVAGGPGARPEPVAGTVYDAVLLDLAAAPDHLGLLRRRGAVSAATDVRDLHGALRPAELERRLRLWRPAPDAPHRTLLLGGSRSGKSAEAELRLAAEPHVTYLATGPDGAGDAEWAARVAAHRARRPAWWDTVETADAAAVLASHRGTLLLDGVGTWLAAAMDRTRAWDDPDALAPCVDELVDAWRATAARVVAVTDEVGLSLVPGTRAGRLFRDALGTVNQRLAAHAEDAALVVAGRVLELA
ncbi:bifunctional adenosylcobinamide kinase/adenosylcobinamide-phosphate guanylyltransferase [Actinomadura parmotrematis]|uniref:bifunctional adenosylcobinamide kinase/adenosylcobinamide-phosphate guanylyltransferase n=1 Tax=Actinomadura parmotrematis TaxID=2864039 RepID=UPI00215DA0EC|nr:bifunctional adenosylcobinamide kinase/adenosylcobinamide-phosphate guanylyltransferase [Actinomadura parmotrematis]